MRYTLYFYICQRQALSPLMTAEVKPSCSISLSPFIVIPPAVVTLSISTSGLLPEARSSSAAPLTVYSTIFLASSGLNPISTPPSDAARMYLIANAIPHDARAVPAGISLSSTYMVVPISSKISQISLI